MPSLLTVTQHITSSPQIRRGKPVVTGTRMTVADVVLMHLRLGLTLPEIAGKYDMPMAGLYAAMTYYYDHKAEIDESIEEDEAFAEAFHRQNVSPLQEKLHLLRNA